MQQLQQPPKSPGQRLDDLTKQLWESRRGTQDALGLLTQRVSRLEKNPATAPNADQGEAVTLRAELAELAKEVESQRIILEKIVQETTISRGIGGYGERLIQLFSDLVADRLYEHGRVEEIK